MLVYFIRQRKDFPYPWLVALFAGFIIACGTTHLLSAITIWNPLYWLDGLFKGLTAIISLITAVLMLWIIPRALSLPSSTQLQAEIQQKKAAEAALQEAFDRLHKIAGRVPGVVGLDPGCRLDCLGCLCCLGRLDRLDRLGGGSNRGCRQSSFIICVHVTVALCKYGRFVDRLLGVPIIRICAEVHSVELADLAHGDVV